MEHPFERLVNIMHELRKKCPWDRKQTRESLRPYLLEETYEVLDAIESGDPEKLKEELGDLLLLSHLLHMQKQMFLFRCLMLKYSQLKVLNPLMFGIEQRVLAVPHFVESTTTFEAIEI